MRVLYVAPAEGERGGIADYASRFRLALDAAGIERVDLPVAAGTPDRAALRRLDGRVADLAAFDLAHVEIGTNSLSELHVARTLARNGVPTVLTSHEPSVLVARAMGHLGGRVMPRALNAVGRRRLRALVDAAAAVVVLGPSAQERFEAAWGRPARVIPHVTLGGARARPDLEPVRVLYAGFFGPGKGLEVLAEAFGAIEATLVVAGAEFETDARDPIGAVLARFPDLSPRLERTGFLEAAQFEALFASCQIGVVPYAHSVPGGSSGILMRCLDAGLATVCSDSPALEQDVEDGVTGVVVPAGDAPTLAAALRRLVGDPSLRRALGDAAATAASSQRGLQATGARIAAVYADALANA